MSYEGLPKSVDHLDVSSNEIEALASHSPLENVRYVQVDRGSLQGRLRGYRLPSGFLWGSWSNVGGVGQAEIPRGCLLVGLVGAGAQRDSWHGRPIGAGDLVLGSRQSGLHHRAGLDHQVWVWLLPEALLEIEAEALGRDLRPFHEALVSSPQGGPAKSSLGVTLDHCLRILQEPSWQGEEERLRQVEAVLLGATVQRLSPTRGPISACDTSLKIAAAARDYLHEHVHGPIRMANLCGHVGVCERTLRYHFTRTYQCSPSQYHLSIRLNRVRRNLIHAVPGPGAVGRAAAAAGFWHMGRFSQMYRSLFAETPSQTLRQGLAGLGVGRPG
jgi:AraC-like DNA-binding protein